MGGEGAAAAEGVRGMRIVLGFGKDVAYICWGLYWAILGHIGPHIFLQTMSIPGPRGAPWGKTPPRPLPVVVSGLPLPSRGEFDPVPTPFGSPTGKIAMPRVRPIWCASPL
jgi:hypothetical protein